MTLEDTRVRDPMSRAEMERRWAIARAIMDEHDIDAIVVRGSCNALGIGGYYRWIVGTAAIGSYPTTAIFPRRGEMTIVTHGGFGGDFPMDPDGAEYPGAGRRLTSPSFPMIHYSGPVEADLAASDLKKRGCRRIALLGSFGMGYDFVHRMLNEVGGGVEVVTITDAIDEAKAIKSLEEIEFIRKAAAMQDALIPLAAKIIRPGMREFEIAAELNYHSALAGCQTGFMLISSGQFGDPGPPMFPRHLNLQGKTLREGDIVLVVIENSGPGGYVTHISRNFVLGPVTQRIEDLHQAQIAAQDYTLSLLTPGAAFADAFNQYNDYMEQRGLGRETRLHAHGQGYDIVERPLVRMDETMTVSANMNIGIHPTVLDKGVLILSTDNYLIGGMGSERLHKAERKVFEIGA